MTICTTALVLAAPERKRILRELLNTAEPWTVAQRLLYREMVMGEYLDHRDGFDAAMLNTVEHAAGARLILQGVPADKARVLAVAESESKLKWVHEVMNGKRFTAGQKERERRRTFREAVTAYDGATAVTTGLIHTCIVCGDGFRQGIRNDSAYCSNGCRQAAYRKRQKLRVA